MMLLLLALQPGCKKMDGFNTVISNDKTKPGVVTNIKVANFSGGAYITYSLPDSKNILYVQAQYKINDKASRQSKSSYYSDSVTVGGFAKSQDYQVVLWTVSRAEVRSDSVVVTVHPDTPAYLRTLPTVKMKNDFGGVHILAVNKVNAPIGVITITTDAQNKWQIISQNYSTLDTIQFSLRGYDTVSRKFGVYITDQWGNISDTVFNDITPIYEAQVDKSKFLPYVLNSDAPTGFGWVLQNLWNDQTTSPGYHTAQPIQPLVWPAVITFDMGQSAKLSRYTIWDRGLDGANYLWEAGAPLTWVLWGRTSTPVDETMRQQTICRLLEERLPAAGSTWASLRCRTSPPSCPIRNIPPRTWLSGMQASPIISTLPFPKCVTCGLNVCRTYH